MDCNLPGSSVHGIFHARILEWVAISFSRGSSWPRYQTCVSCTGRQILYHWVTKEAPFNCLLDTIDVWKAHKHPKLTTSTIEFILFPQNFCPCDIPLCKRCHLLAQAKNPKIILNTFLLISIVSLLLLLQKQTSKLVSSLHLHHLVQTIILSHLNDCTSPHWSACLKRFSIHPVWLSENTYQIMLPPYFKSPSERHRVLVSWKIQHSKGANSSQFDIEVESNS